MCLDCSGSSGAVRRRFGGTRSPSARRAIPVADGLAIYPRSTWAGDSRPALTELYPEEVRFLLVHHTAGPSDYTEDGAIAEMQGVYSFHTGPEKGWPDVCYNFFIDRFGRVFEARTGSLDGPVMADATGGNQGFAQLVCLLGDFTDAMPTPEAIAALTRTLTWLASRHHLEMGADATTNFVSRGSNRWPKGVEVTTNTIAGHRDMSQTACPGDAFYPYVTSTLRTDVGSLAPAAAAATTSPVDATSPAASPSTTPATPPTVAPAQSASPATATQGAPSTTSVAVTPSSNAAPAGTDSHLGQRLIVGTGATVLVAGAAAGLVWVLKRRIEHQSPRS